MFSWGARNIRQAIIRSGFYNGRVGSEAELPPEAEGCGLMAQRSYGVTVPTRYRCYVYGGSNLS